MERKNTRQEEMTAETVNDTVESNLDAVVEELKEQAKDSKAEDIMEKLLQKEEELNEQNNRFLRLNADFQNYKKRVEKEKTDLYQFANEKIAIDLLPIMDNLERALSSSKEDKGNGDSIAKGVQMILEQFQDVLKKHGIKEIKAQGEMFDPNFHHAVMQESHEKYESNHIIDVFQKGYSLNGRVIRPSMVKVAN